MNQHRLPDQIPPPYAVDSSLTAQWAAWVREQWDAVRVTHLETNPMLRDVRSHLRLRANVHLGSLTPADVRVEATTDAAEAVDGSAGFSIPLSSMQSYNNGTYVFEGLLPVDAFENDPPTVRVRPGAAHEMLSALREVARSSMFVSIALLQLVSRGNRDRSR